MYLKKFMLLTILHFAVSETYDKVNLTYGYETRCPDCVQFANTQFYNGYKQISDYINLELLVVVGGVDETALFCMHGENECFISKAQACAFERPGVTQALRVEFLHCTEQKVSSGEDVVDADIEVCVNSVLKDLVSYDTVKNCMNTDEEYIPLLKAYNNKVQEYGIEFVPWLAFFGVFNDTEEVLLEQNFVLTICSKLTNPPDVCDHIN